MGGENLRKYNYVMLLFGASVNEDCVISGAQKLEAPVGIHILSKH